MIWESVIIIYLVAGFMFSWMSSIGHQLMYNYPLPWSSWVAGIIGWPIVFLIGGRKK